MLGICSEERCAYAALAQKIFLAYGGVGGVNKKLLRDAQKGLAPARVTYCAL